MLEEKTASIDVYLTKVKPNIEAQIGDVTNILSRILAAV